MGLIREPKNVDFYVLDKPWTVEERKEFSAFIKLRIEKRKKKHTKNNNIRTKKSCCLARQSCFMEAIPSGQNAFAKYGKDKQTLAIVHYRLQSGLTEKKMQLKKPANENQQAE